MLLNPNCKNIFSNQIIGVCETYTDIMEWFIFFAHVYVARKKSLSFNIL